MPTESIVDIPLNKIAAAPQVREQFDEESILGLAQSMKQIGQAEPIRVRRQGDQFVVLIGERRVRAARQAGFTTIAAIVEERELNRSAILQRQLIENLQRQDLTAMEKARGIQQFMAATGCNASDAAGKLGLSSSAIARLLPLLSLPEEIRQQVESGRISASAAYELTHEKDAARQAALAAQLANGQLTRDGLSGTLRNGKKTSPSADGHPCRVTAFLGAGRSITVSGPGLDLEVYIQWLEELLGKARKVRPQGVELTTLMKMLRDQAKA